MTAMRTYDMPVQLYGVMERCEVSFVVYPAQPEYDDCPGEPAWPEIIGIYCCGENVSSLISTKEFNRIMDELSCSFCEE